MRAFVLTVMLHAVVAPAAQAEPRVKVTSGASDVASPAQRKPWTWSLLLEPFDLMLGLFPAFELQRSLGNADKPTSVALAFYGVKNNGGSIFGTGKYGGADGYEFATEESVQHDMQVLTARYKLFLMRSFHFNFGAGFRAMSSKETATFKDGSKQSAQKSSVDFGGELGLGNRWVTSSGFVIGGTWLVAYAPAVTLASKDAKLPAGYRANNPKNDSKSMALRMAVLDIGWAW